MGAFSDQFGQILCFTCKERERDGRSSYCNECLNVMRNKYRQQDRTQRIVTQSSNLILGPYKMPLTKYESGFGYMGALTFDVEGKIQCHICGVLVDHLAQHARKLHKLTASKYKEKFDLKKTSALISEKIREERKAHGLRVWLRKTPEEREKFIQSQRGHRNITFKRSALEYKNLHGICPEQLLKTITDASEFYGRTPSQNEYEVFHGTSRFFGPIRKTFGTWNNAVSKAGLSFYVPTKSGGVSVRYSDEELLEILSDYARINKVTPMRSDFRRGLLPKEETYTKRFGSIIEARRLAGIEEYEDGRFKGSDGKKRWQSQKDKKILELSENKDSDIVKSAEGR